MSTTNLFRQAFKLWERTTNAYVDALVRNPLFLTASGLGLNSALMFKRATDSSMLVFLSLMGLPNRRDQEKTLHLLHQIDGRLDDLEFRLEGARAPKARAGTGA